MRIVNDLLYFVKCKYCRLYFLFCNILQYSFDFNPFSVFRHGTQIEIRPTLLRRCRNRKSACGRRQDRAVGFRRKPRDFSARRATGICAVRSFGKSAHSYRRRRRFLSGGHGINARLATSRRLFKRARPQKNTAYRSTCPPLLGCHHSGRCHHHETPRRNAESDNGRACQSRYSLLQILPPV